MKNNKGRGGGAFLFSSTEKGGILEGGVLFERGGGWGLNRGFTVFGFILMSIRHTIKS